MTPFPARAAAAARILVVGDIMLDRYWFGEVDRISPEAPVPVVRVARREDRLGGAANVARNIVALGAQVGLLGVIGADEAGIRVRTLTREAGVRDHLVEDPAGMDTTLKMRVLGRQQQLLRVDFEQGPGAGALDAVDTPVLGAADMTRPASSLLAKIDAVAAQQADARKPALVVAPAAAAVSDALVAIGASAGGPAALATLLGRLPANFGAGVIVVQHVDDAFTPGMATWLDQQTALTVRLAKAGDRPTAGTVLLAGGNRHLRVDGSGRCTYSDEPKDAVYRPSIDVFLSSVAEHWRARAVGVLLTGMGRDGAAGLGDMRTRGFITIAQDRATSAVYGMPKAAAEAGAASEILPLPTIAPQLVALFGTV